MRQLKHENIIDIMEIFIPQEYRNFSDVYVVSSLMETDLTCAGGKEFRHVALPLQARTY